MSLEVIFSRFCTAPSLKHGLIPTTVFTYWSLWPQTHWTELHVENWTLNFASDLLIRLSSGHTVVFADESGMNASRQVMLGTMDVHHQWTKVMPLHCFCCHVFGVLFVFWCLLHLSPAVSAAVQLSQPTSAGRLAEGEDQPSPGWNAGDPHGQDGTSPAHRRALQQPQHVPQEPGVPTPPPAPQEPAGAHHVVGEVLLSQLNASITCRTAV